MLLKSFFGKEIDEITETDLVQFFSEEKEESTQKEFKSFNREDQRDLREKIFTISQSICAFLNSEGGILIWGAPLGTLPEGRKEKIFVGELTPLNLEIEKDSFISKISDLIIPIPQNIKFKKICVGDGFVYIIETSKSEIAPHQLKDKFYMRLDGQTRVAPYHYIEALFKKIKFPNIGGFLKINGIKSNTNRGITDHFLRITFVFMNFSKYQNDHHLSYKALISIGEFNGWNHSIPPNYTFENNGTLLRAESIKDTIHFGEALYESHTIKIPQLKLSENKGVLEIFLYFGAKNSPMKQSSYVLEIKTLNPPNPNDFIVEMHENILMADLTDIESEGKLKDFLGR